MTCENAFIAPIFDEENKYLPREGRDNVGRDGDRISAVGRDGCDGDLTTFMKGDSPPQAKKIAFLVYKRGFAKRKYARDMRKIFFGPIFDGGK